MGFSQPVKLTLRLDRSLIERAKHYADERGTSVSQIVADYFQALTREEPSRPDDGGAWKQQLPPITRRFVSRTPPVDVSEDDYRRHLEEKHR